jgi:hypothetical protein
VNHLGAKMKSFLFPFIIFCALVWSPEPTWSHTELTKGYRFGLSQNHLLARPLETINALGLGLTSAYEFILTERFTLGIDLEYRHFSGEAATSQLGYGLLMKHYLTPSQLLEQKLVPFVEYGLLMSVTRQKGRPYSGTAHDTKLGAGANFTVGETPLFAEASYHFSRLTYFEQQKLNFDYLQIAFGWRGSL